MTLPHCFVHIVLTLSLCRHSLPVAGNSGKKEAAMSETELVRRLERLERENRRLRLAGMAAFCVAAALALMGVARPVPQVLTAEKFNLVNAAGQELAHLGMGKRGPELALYNSDGEPQVLLEAGPRPTLTLYGAGHVSAALSVKELGPSLTLAGADGKASAELSIESSNPSLNLFDAVGNLAVWLTVQDSNPLLSLKDPNGYDTDIGSTQLITLPTGEIQQTSAASIVMFGKDKKHPVIWEAPR
jgi:hypothetical protein